MICCDICGRLHTSHMFSNNSSMSRNVMFIILFPPSKNTAGNMMGAGSQSSSDDWGPMRRGADENKEAWWQTTSRKLWKNQQSPLSHICTHIAYLYNCLEEMRSEKADTTLQWQADTAENVLAKWPSMLSKSRPSIWTNEYMRIIDDEEHSGLEIITPQRGWQRVAMFTASRWFLKSDPGLAPGQQGWPE